MIPVGFLLGIMVRVCEAAFGAYQMKFGWHENAQEIEMGHVFDPEKVTDKP